MTEASDQRIPEVVQRWRAIAYLRAAKQTGVTVKIVAKGGEQYLPHAGATPQSVDSPFVAVRVLGEQKKRDIFTVKAEKLIDVILGKKRSFNPATTLFVRRVRKLREQDMRQLSHQ